MSLQFNVNPYFDDFNPEKNYQKILFKPGLAVQARELNQLQTALQEQITRFGSHIFVEGSIVLNSERFFDNNLRVITHEGTIQDITGKSITGVESGTVALVKGYDEATRSILFTETSGSGIIPGEQLTYVNENELNVIISTTGNPLTYGMVFSVNSGVMFVSGCFIYNTKQTIILDTKSKFSSHSVGFQIVEEIVTSDDDQTLLDNAQGSPNFAAPGADRYAINLVLTRRDIGVGTEDFIELARIENGELIYVNDRALYSELEREFARRTYDESGNYTVRPFELSFENHRPTALVRPIISSGSVVGFTVVDSGDEFEAIPEVKVVGNGSGATASAILTNKKLTSVNVVSGGTGYTDEETYVIVSGDPNKFTAKLDPGKAYVLGYEFETKAPTYVSINRSRTTEFVESQDMQVYYGNYVNITSLLGVLNTDSLTTVELHNVAHGSVNGATTQIGTAQVRFIDYVSGTVGTNAVYRLHLFNINITSGAFSDLESIVIRSGATVTAGANIDNSSKVGGSPTGETYLSGTDRSSLIFPMNNSYVKELKDQSGNFHNDYSFKRVYSGVAFTSSSASITTDGGGERFVGGTGALAADVIDENYLVVVTAAGSSSYTVGQVIRATAASGGTISPGVAHTITLSVPGNVGFTATVIATINGDSQAPRVKSLSTYTSKVISAPNTVQNNFDSIGYSDIHKMSGVYRFTVDPTGQYTVNPTTGVLTSALAFTNVTGNYNFDNGQRDDLIDHGRLQLTGTAPTTGNFLVVVFNYFTTTGKGFSSIDSYSLPYTDIPTYKSKSNGTVYSLGDVLDFRPIRQNNTSTFGPVQLPHPQIQFQADYSYYVGRIDRITATAGKTFAIKEGIPSSIPKVPTEDADGMTLYVISVPPYTENLSDISVKYIDNKRYTMRDIGNLEKRIENLEYYTQLSLLEKQASEETILDSTGMDKFKNGFFVDPFTSADSLYNENDESSWSRQIYGWWNTRKGAVTTWNQGVSRLYSSSVSDSTHEDYHAAIEPIQGELRAEVFTAFGDFTFNLVNSLGTKKSGKAVTLNYTEKRYITNPLASKTVNINPYDVIAFNGAVDLQPSTDLWVDTNVLPAVNKVVDVQIPDAPSINNRNVTGFYSRGYLWKTTSVESKTVQNVIGQATASLGSSVVDVQYLPYARARSILAIGSKFKPKARLYPFFESIPFSENVRPMTVLETSNNTGIFDQVGQETIQIRTGSTSGPIVATAKVAIYSPPSTADNTKRLLSVFDVVGTLPNPGTTPTYVTTSTKNAEVTEIITYVAGAPIYPDEYGLIGVEIDLPADTLKTGSRTFRLVDNIDNDAQSSQSVGDAIYFAQGTLQTTEETILTTRTVQNQTITTTTGYYYDPLAQTFNIDPRFNPNGVHVSSVDVFFRTKSETIPVSLEITKTVNGYPESVITSIPFALSEKLPDEIAISEDGSVPTKFTLDSPVNLVPGEYAIVLRANTQEYEVFVSEMGKTDLITNQIITKQPYAGVFFKSSNASTWTAFQEEDLKFNLNIAQFESSGVAEFSIQDIEEFDFSAFNVRTNNMIPAGTSLNFQVKAMNDSGIMDSDFSYITTNSDLDYGAMKKVDGVGSFLIRAEMATNDPSVSPMIDIEGLGVVYQRNNINQVVGSTEEVTSGGPALARYLTKPITLADGFESSNLVVTIDGCIPSGTDILVYAKMSPTGSSTPFQYNNWVQLERNGTVINSINEFDFKEMKYYPPGAFGNYGVPIDKPLEPFNIFAVKIVLSSTTPINTPKVRNLRCIALPL